MNGSDHEEARRKMQAEAGNDDRAERRPEALPDAAKRALAEAEKRRRQKTGISAPREVNGRKGPDPARYGDWEKKGIAVDF